MKCDINKHLHISAHKSSPQNYRYLYIRMDVLTRLPLRFVHIHSSYIYCIEREMCTMMMIRQ